MSAENPSSGGAPPNNDPPILTPEQRRRKEKADLWETMLENHGVTLQVEDWEKTKVFISLKVLPDHFQLAASSPKSIIYGLVQDGRIDRNKPVKVQVPGRDLVCDGDCIGKVVTLLVERIHDPSAMPNFDTKEEARIAADFVDYLGLRNDFFITNTVLNLALPGSFDDPTRTVIQLSTASDHMVKLADSLAWIKNGREGRYPKRSEKLFKKLVRHFAHDNTRYLELKPILGDDLYEEVRDAAMCLLRADNRRKDERNSSRIASFTSGAKRVKTEVSAKRSEHRVSYAFVAEVHRLIDSELLAGLEDLR